MIFLYASALLSAIITMDPACPKGSELVIRVYPEYQYFCAWPEQLLRPLPDRVPPDQLHLYWQNDQR